MSKAKTRKRRSARAGSERVRSERRTVQSAASPLMATSPNRGSLPVTSSTNRTLKHTTTRFASLGPSGLVTSGMVALGCWGMTVFFFFLYPDPNHVLFGCFAALMALMWSYSFVARLRKALRPT